MKKIVDIQVELSARSYPIYIGEGLLENLEIFKQHIPHKQVMIVSNPTIAPLYLEKLQKTLFDANFQCEVCLVPDGEDHKNFDSLNLIYDSLLSRNYDKSATLCALGGGVIGDLTGFAAATYRRGIHFLQIPTTLLAQVDAAIGGKTAVNHPLGKNMIGAIYQPKAVFVDSKTLASLPMREYRAGLAEIIKYGLILDANFFAWLEKNMQKLLERDKEVVQQAIAISCGIKAKVVSEDEMEKGERVLLNLGHTFGHAIEAATHYQMWLHGEAVAMGIVLASHLSLKLDLLEQEEFDRIIALLQLATLPITPPKQITSEQIYQLMMSDKKVMAKQLHLILLKKIGHAFVTNEFRNETLQDILNAYFA